MVHSGEATSSPTRQAIVPRIVMPSTASSSRNTDPKFCPTWRNDVVRAAQALRLRSTTLWYVKTEKMATTRTPTRQASSPTKLAASSRSAATTTIPKLLTLKRAPQVAFSPPTSRSAALMPSAESTDVTRDPTSCSVELPADTPATASALTSPLIAASLSSWMSPKDGPLKMPLTTAISSENSTQKSQLPVNRRQPKPSASPTWNEPDGCVPYCSPGPP